MPPISLEFYSGDPGLGTILELLNRNVNIAHEFLASIIAAAEYNRPTEH